MALKGQFQDEIYIKMMEEQLSNCKELLASKDREIAELREQTRIIQDGRGRINERELKFWNYYDLHKTDTMKHVNAKFYPAREYWEHMHRIEDDENNRRIMEDINDELRAKVIQQELKIKELIDESYASDISST
ncbi:hypothetical protein OS493_034471 [Desmophyllum pertusum]|uniref:Uncharacterized protein n=1 Tax=Desmophyllum pertusum TaxID=174260 RepID=A0A9X0CUW4_9CNID|nr:hypothetical protein OS493_034471 [Desmophyllum pertusum]